MDDNAEGIGRQTCLVLDRLMSRRPVAARDIPVQPLGVVTRRSTDVLAVEHPASGAREQFPQPRPGWCSFSRV